MPRSPVSNGTRPALTGDGRHRRLAGRPLPRQLCQRHRRHRGGLACRALRHRRRPSSVDPLGRQPDSQHRAGERRPAGQSEIAEAAKLLQVVEPTKDERSTSRDWSGPFRQWAAPSQATSPERCLPSPTSKPSPPDHGGRAREMRSPGGPAGSATTRPTSRRSPSPLRRSTLGRSGRASRRGRPIGSADSSGHPIDLSPRPEHPGRRPDRVRR